MTPEQKRKMRKHAVALDDYHDEVREDLLECLEEIDRLQDALRDAICFMKDAKKVSIKSRGIQLEAEFFGGSA
jgi:hypothetical protein